MTIVFVGINPSQKNKDPSIPFVGTRSHKMLMKWIELAGVKDYDIINIYDAPTPKNRSLRSDEVRSAYHTFPKKLEKYKEYKLVSLGQQPSDFLMKLRIPHHRMPHPSPRNRLLNNPRHEIIEIRRLKAFVEEVSK